ncbi:anhydro-N-acetylmuramic acid kinase [Microbacterium sp. YY-01]|uniref:anhydro-N-acetylmuramic acid kinase n=1 Tax=Microbacterium sp. YY-01 TaxID=3421634 RepID=UPI003D1863F7
MTRLRIASVQSGTSADAIDVLVVEVESVDDAVHMHPVTSQAHAWPDYVRREILAITQGEPADAARWCRLDTALGECFAEATAEVLRESGPCDFVVSHGQTLYHWHDGERTRGTLQLGEPSLIAERCGVPVLSHVRHADIAAGGEGAPLMAVFDRLWLGAEAAQRRRNFASVNIGGIANAQVISPDGTLTAWDTGPGNALIDAAVMRATENTMAYDRDGTLALQGRVQQPLIEQLMLHPYLQRTRPKTTGRHEFGDDLLDAIGIGNYRSEDAIATLVEYTAMTIARDLVPHSPAEVIVSGGGVHHPLLMRRLAELMSGGAAEISTVDNTTVHSSAERGVGPDMKENLLFALLGAHSWYGIPVSLGVTPARIAGRWSTAPHFLTRESPLSRMPQSVPAPPLQPSTVTPWNRLEVVA